MKRKYTIIFIVFLMGILFFSQLKMDIGHIESTLYPDFVLEDSKVDHFVHGEKTFSVDANKIEIYKEDQFLIYDAMVKFEGDIHLQADEIEASFKDYLFYAKHDVVMTFDNFMYEGNAVTYWGKEKRFLGYDSGRITVIN